MRTTKKMRRKPSLQQPQRSARRYHPSQLAYDLAMLSCTAYCSNFVKSKLMFSVSTQEEAVEEEEEEEDDEEEDEEPAKVSIYYQLPYGRCTEPFAQFKNLAL